MKHKEIENSIILEADEGKILATCTEGQFSYGTIVVMPETSDTSDLWMEFESITEAKTFYNIGEDELLLVASRHIA